MTGDGGGEEKEGGERGGKRERDNGIVGYRCH